MEILGVGGAELVVILIIMLVVAGPKRMLRWAYILGMYISKMRALWAESMKHIEREMREAGMDVELPKEPPTRANINRQVNRMLDPVIKPVKETLDDTRAQLEDVKKQATITERNGHSLNQPRPAAPPSSDSQPNLGTWSGSKSSDD